MRFISDDQNPNRSALGPRMKVIGAGLPRCATSSLQAALEMPSMGFFPCMHMAHIAPHVSRSKVVHEAMREDDVHRRRKLLHQIFDGYEATTDFPGMWFVGDLMDMYPDAAIVLNQRKGGGVPWAKSLKDSLSFFGGSAYRWICLPVQADRQHWALHQTASADWKERFGADAFSPAAYDMHQKHVLAEAKKRGREVLIWQAQDGWAPLCKFLGKEVPQGEFPWVNDKATVDMVKKIVVARGIICWLGIVGGLFASWKFGPGVARMVMERVGELLK